MHDWDDLRVFLAVARAKTLTGAAHNLGIDAATAGRRLTRLETALKATLFARAPSGLRLSASGARLMDAALAAESAMEAVGRANEGDPVGGAVRLSASEGFGAAIIAPALPKLRAERPQLRIELAAQTGFLSASMREADIAVTLAAPSSTRIVVEPLTEYGLGLYGARAYLESAGVPDNIDALRTHSVVGYVDDLIYAPELRYLDEIAPGLSPALASSSIRAQREMIAAGGGLGVLPCFLAEGLTRVLGKQVRLTRRFWLSTHRDVADTARVRAVSAWLKREVKRQAARLAGD